MDNFTEIERLKKKGIIGEKTSQIYLGKQGVARTYAKPTNAKPKVNYLRRRVLTLFILCALLGGLIFYMKY